MAKNAEATIQGLNIIPTDTLSDELSPISDDINRDLEAQLAMWTNFQFPNSSSLTSSSSNNANANPDNDEDERIFSPERDTASRSRHKAIPVEDFTSGHFFGNVGASLAHPPDSHAAAYERAKFQQLQQHVLNQNNNNAHTATGSRNTGGNMGMGRMGDNHQVNELFSFFPNADMNLNTVVVDPFLSPSDITGGGGYGNQLPPLTIHPTHGRPHPQQHSAFPSHMPQLQTHQQQQQQMQIQTIDPATTTLGHRVTLPLPSNTPSMKRQQKKGSVSRNISLVIPVDRDYTAPSSAIGDDDMDQDQHHDSNINMDGMDGMDEYNAPRELDASGNPIPYSAAEDKRRRNTLASARFRQKKKEREAAMEKKARELDDRVAGLERECESLRKENRMLRGLLVDGVPAGVASSNNNSNSATTSSTSAEEMSLIDGKNAIGSGASVVLLEELVRLLKANSAVLSSGSGQQAAPTPANGRTATTGKRKRAVGN